MRDSGESVQQHFFSVYKEKEDLKAVYTASPATLQLGVSELQIQHRCAQ
jgi:hypothetical protein